MGKFEDRIWKRNSTITRNIWNIWNKKWSRKPCWKDHMITSETCIQKLIKKNNSYTALRLLPLSEISSFFSHSLSQLYAFFTFHSPVINFKHKITPVSFLLPSGIFQSQRRRLFDRREIVKQYGITFFPTFYLLFDNSQGNIKRCI